jgi:glycosyltransferase involved in cell wall biosynthesis
MSSKKTKHENLWALIPAYNEEKSIKEVIMRTKKIVNNLLIINDGSTDNTKKILNKIKNINLIHLNENSGKANALKIGMTYLKKKNAKKVVTLDADLQHLPEEISKLLKVNADLVIGIRKKLNSPMPFFRKIGNYLAAKIVSFQTGLTLNDPQSGFRIYGTRAINELSFEGSKFNIEKKTLKEASEKKFIIKETSISCIYEKNARKSYNKMKDAFEFLKS